MADKTNPAYKHGHAGRNDPHPLYNTWCSIIDRCTNPNAKRYKDYGNRGITISPLWRHDFAAFLDYVGDRPEGMTLDRIDNDKGYEPGNLHWATAKEQSRNRRGRRMWTWGGETLMLSQWAEVLELHYDNLRARLDKSNDLFPKDNKGRLIHGRD